MSDTKCARRWVWRFLLSAMAACLASGAALATCNLNAQTGAVPCYIRVQPIDVGNVTQTGIGSDVVTTQAYSPFNLNSTVDPTGSITGVGAGMTFQTAPTLTTSPSSTALPSGTPPSAAPNNAGTATPPLANIPAAIPNNSTSSNPIGFVVQPGSPSALPGSGTAVDVTRTLLNQLGIDLVWLPMTEYVYNTGNLLSSACAGVTYVPPVTSGCVPDTTKDFTNLQITLAPVGAAVAPSPGTPNAQCKGYITGTTLTITAGSPDCFVPGSTAPAALAVYDFLATTAKTAIASGTFITGTLTGTGSRGTYTVNTSQTVGSSKSPVVILATPSTLTSSDFKTLSQQTITTPPTAISQGGTPVSPLGGAALTPAFSPPDPTIVNMFFVNTLTPPAGIGGTLFGLGWICNNGVAISSQVFAQGRPDTLAHELLHNLCLDHTTYGAGPWTAPGAGYAAPGGVVPVIPGTPLPGECDSNYPACGANLMTAGNARDEPTLGCILAGAPGTDVPGACFDASGNQLPGFYNTNPLKVTDRLSFPVMGCGAGGTPPSGSPPLSACATQLPVPQQAQVIQGGVNNAQFSGLLFPDSPHLNFSGLLSPIPQETTKAQLGTSGSSTGRAIFDLSGPAGGKPGETLLGWVLTLPRGQSFSRHDGFHIVSQSREDLVQDVKYYPGPENNPLKRNIAYQRIGDNSANDPTIAAADQGPCAFTTTECLVVKFQPPGLGADETISFSNNIVSGDAPITNEDLCKAQITYVFSDGYVTTSNFGVCPPAALPLIANSWHPDPHVAPHVVPSNLLLAQASSSLGCTPDPTGACPDVDATSIADSDVFQDAGAPQRSCDNGATMKGSVDNPVTGMISGANIIITGGQTCHYQDCEFAKNLTINNATAYLQNCTVAGNLTMNSGKLYTLPLDPQSTAPSVDVLGNLTIGNPDSLPNSFSIGPGTTVEGTGVVVQYVPTGGLGYICGITALGNVNVNNNMSPIQIGNNTQEKNCVGINSITGHLNCNGNTPPPTGGGNTIKNGANGQCSGF